MWCMYSYIEKANQNEMWFELLRAGINFRLRKDGAFHRLCLSKVDIELRLKYEAHCQQVKSSLFPPSLPLCFLSYFMSDVCASSSL